jgi:hypothetical protein
MEIILKVIEKNEYDMYVFISYQNDQIVGLNFHFGIGNIDYNFSKPCPHLTEIYNKLSDQKSLTEEGRIDKAIDLYIDAFLVQNNNQVVLPSGQAFLIKKALLYYIEQSNKFNASPNDNEAYEKFDMQTLAAMMNYEISVSINEGQRENFASKHGVDFPIYVK